MPRRPPPSALLLHHGPTPPRSQPKHTLPALPRPAFCTPKDGFSAAKLPLHPTRAMIPDAHVPLTPAPAATSTHAPAPRSAAGTAAAASASWLWSWLPMSSSSPEAAAAERTRLLSSPGSSRTASVGGTSTNHSDGITGPWNHSRSLKEAESTLDVDRIVRVPQPAAVTTSPLLSNVW
ncbi:hypothetical protein JB92DRAFT_2853919 [Gautieria morchelliformis]|nr:hypothetical protein JB92DRAFT_2853919 [Gautieria morchelliformis]